MYESKLDPLLNIGKIYVFQLDIEKIWLRRFFNIPSKILNFAWQQNFRFEIVRRLYSSHVYDQT